jgi:hypothetical protein
LAGTVQRTEVHHVALRGARHKCSTNDGIEPAFAGAEYAAHQQVGDLVVVTSITPASKPESASFSIDWPPVPVAWNTRQS